MTGVLLVVSTAKTDLPTVMVNVMCVVTITAMIIKGMLKMRYGYASTAMGLWTDVHIVRDQ
jgi:hypothetical protein